MYNPRSLFAIAATALLAGSAQADAVIQSVQTAGSGCPGGNSVVANQSASNLLTMSSAPRFQVSMGGDPAAKSKNCQALIVVSVGPNEQFTVTQSDFPAWARLDAGTSVSVFPSFYFQSHAADTFSTRKDFSGDQFLNGAGFSVTSADVSADLWSACGQQDVVVVNYRLALLGEGRAEAAGLVDPGQNIQVVSRPC